MPRLSLYAHDIDARNPSESQEDWDAQPAAHLPERRNHSGDRRSRDEPRVHRFNAGEALDRKRADRRKSVRRGRR